MLRAIASSIRRKLMFVVLATTFTALLVTAIAMVMYDVRTYQQAWVNDLVTQADIVGRASAPAIAFDDRNAARETLDFLRGRPRILAAALYEPDGSLFASYAQPSPASESFPALPVWRGYRIEDNHLTLLHNIVEGDEVIGTVYLRARYELMQRLQSYLGILGTVMIASLVVALLVSYWLQAAVTRPILEVTAVAHQVIQKRDFSLRVRKSTDDEVGILVDAFNDMLAEVGQAEKALRAADQRKDEFLATLAHELRNPMAPLLNALELLRVAAHDPAVASSARDMMERQLKQMVRLVDDLLDVSRITTGKLVLRKERTELAVIVRNAVDTVRPFIEARGHTLALELPPQPIYLHADATRLAQVFSNLINNAAKYTDPGGHIAFSAALQGAEVEVTVSDSGIGISAEMLSRIFEMFTQADRSLERTQSGLGVGLSLAKRLVELHGGSIEARSGGLGQGSRLIVRLPVVAAEPASGTAPPRREAMPSAGARRILLADDNVDFATSLATLLRGLGHEVVVTHDGEAALATATRFRPDFAFLDIGLPALNGYDLATRLRAQRAGAQPVLVAVTGWGQAQDRKLAEQAGFDYHLVKPVDLEQIVALLRSAPPASAPG